MKGGANKACAACKYQRRRCSKDCPLAPYFPADKPKTFSNAHRLFGVANIIRIMNQVAHDEKDEAMKSIIFESDIRAKYPQHGCYGVIMQYQDMICKAAEELQYVQSLLTLYKESNYQMQHHHLMHANQTYLLSPTIYNNVSASIIDSKPDLTSMQRLSSVHGELNIPTTNARSVLDIPFIDARSEELNVEMTSDAINEKSNLMLLSCHEKEDNIPSNTNARSVEIPINDAATANARFNMSLMSSNDHEEHDASASCLITSFNTNDDVDTKYAKIDLKKSQEPPTWNELDMFQHVNEFVNGSKSVCESSVESESWNREHIQGLHNNNDYLFVRHARA
ncbi:Lateral organ boundary [Sesbania bispinosa]|nr:Lateral organ boundary [Sesbania bispinosa]